MSQFPPLSFPLCLSLPVCALLLIYPCIDCSNWFGGLLPYQPPIQLSEQSIMICHASFQKTKDTKCAPLPPSAISSLIATVAGLSFHVWHFLIIDSMFSLPFEDWNMCSRGHVFQRDCETEMKLIGKVRKKYLEISPTSYGTRNPTICSTRIGLSYITSSKTGS